MRPMKPKGASKLMGTYKEICGFLSHDGTACPKEAAVYEAEKDGPLVTACKEHKDVLIAHELKGWRKARDHADISP